MIRRRLVRATEPELDPAEVAILLGGWRAYPRDGRGDTSAALALYQEGVAGVARRWREHAAWLRAEARRLGVRPAYGGRAQWFFAEYVARGRS